MRNYYNPIDTPFLRDTELAFLYHGRKKVLITSQPLQYEPSISNYQIIQHRSVYPIQALNNLFQFRER